MSSVCDNQDDFNQAFATAVKEYDKKLTKKWGTFMTVYAIIHLLCIVWAVFLAFKSTPPENRVLHVTLAIVFGPAYLIAYALINA